MLLQLPENRGCDVSPPDCSCCGRSSLFVTVLQVFVQMALEGKSWDEVDRYRSAVFFSFGFAYMGFVQYGIYVKLMGQHLWPNAGRFAAKGSRAKLRDPQVIHSVTRAAAYTWRDTSVTACVDC